MAHSRTATLLLLALWPAGEGAGVSGGTPKLPPLPVFAEPVDTADVIREAYDFAGTHSKIVRYVPCFCACSKKYGHKSLEDCFVKSRASAGSPIVWNSHGGECSICLTVAHEARRRVIAGEDVRAIRAAIDEKFTPMFKHRTDTPQPPPPASR